MLNIRVFIVFMLTNLSVCQLIGQKQQSPGLLLPQLKVDNWQMDEGLPVNSIMTIAQAADGWLYFGTEEGLVRFDGKGFTLWNNANIPGLSVNFISAVLGTRDSSLWIGTEGDGLFRFKNNAFFKYSTSNGLSDDHIYSLHEDSDGGLWIGTSGGGLNFLKEGKISILDTASGLASNYVRSMVSDGKGSTWVGTQKGLSLIDHGKIKNFFRKEGLTDEFIESLAMDQNHDLWIGTKSGGLNVYRNGSFFTYTVKDGLTSNSVTSLCFDRSGMLWIGTNGGGITRMNNGKFYPFTSKDGLSGDLIVALYPDREGNIWAGSSGTGIDRIKKKLIQTLTVRDGLPGDVILPVFNDQAGVTWFAVAGKGMGRLEDGKMQFLSRNEGLPEHLILAIGEDHQKTLWIGTAGGGLLAYKNRKFTVYKTENGLSGNVVTALICDRSGAIWAGTTGGGINRFKDGKFSSITTRDGLSHDNVNCILEDHAGNLWVGTNGGLNRLKDNKVTIFNEKNGLSNDYILSIYEDKDLNLWIGTGSNGFNLIRNGKITQFTTKTGLINDVVLNIMEDDYGYFWISCNKGIYKLKRQDLLDFADSRIKSVTPVSYGKADGMESVECNGGVFPAGSKTRDGKLMFPTMKGISIVDPRMMKTASFAFSPVFIEEFLVNGQPVAIVPNLSIPSHSNRLEFRYAALNYANPGRIRYRCMLVGFDKEWIDCGTERSTIYTNIPDGNYTFRVMASNENGQWNDQASAELLFHLKPPFFRSIPFYLVASATLLLLILFVAYYFLSRYQRNRLQLLVDKRTNDLHQEMLVQIQTQEELQKTNNELLVAKDKAESSDRLKTAFMNNISHEIRTPLNGILGFGKFLVEPDLSQDKREHYFSIVKSSSERLLNTMTDFMDISLIATGNQEVQKVVFNPLGFLKEIHHKFAAACDLKQLELILEAPSVETNILINSDQPLLRKVLCHLVDNAIKFTKHGKIRFGFKVNEAELEFFVKDTGVGIQHEVQSEIFNIFWQENISDTRGHEGCGIGLPIVKGIIELLGGDIWVESEKGIGSSFFFTIPLESSSIAAQDTSDNYLKIKRKPLILVVEDEYSSSLLVQHILEKERIEVLTVTDGNQAVHTCRENPAISLVLMDLKMPVMNGYEATRAIKSLRPDLPVIALTAYALSGDEKRAIEAGCDDYIAKPFEKELLLKKLRKFGMAFSE